MRVLFLTTEFPWPATSGGRVRSLQQLRVLASLPEVESITLLSVAEHVVSAAELAALAAAVPKLHVLAPEPHPVHLADHLRHVPRVLALRGLGVPYLAAKWDSARLRARVGELLHTLAPQIVYLDHLGMARYLPEVLVGAPRCRIVLDQHNVESDLFLQLAEGLGRLGRALVSAEWRASRRFERRALRAAHAVAAISHDDARRFRELAGVEAQVVPVVVEPVARAQARAPEDRFCYVGNLRWRPNVAGLDWLCAQAWPAVRARRPAARLEIAGVGLPADEGGAVRAPAAWQVEGVRTLGFVEDLAPLHARSRALLAPVVGGSGVRMKLLEAFGAGLPVVTTPDGAAGLPLVHGRDAWIAATPEAFAEGVARLATDDALADQLRAGGDAFLGRHHSKASAQVAMARVLGVA